MTHVRVVGAGISGLATAWHLADAGFDVDVVDCANRPGGLIHTLHTPDGPVERGAHAFTWTEITDEWFRRLGIAPAFPQPSSRRKFVFRGGRAKRWPLRPGEVVGMAGRAASAWAVGKMGPRDDDSVADWGNRVLGPTATEWLVSPALQGIYAAPADRLSARAVFDARRLRPVGRNGHRLAVPAGGMGEFVDRLADRLTKRGVVLTLDAPATSLDPSTATAICTDVRTAAALVQPHAPRLSMALEAVGTTSMLTVTAFFPRRSGDLRGFGVLFPRRAGIDALGVLFNGEIFVGRGESRSETWIYGSADERLPASDADVIRLLMRDREVLTGRRDEPASVYVTKRPNALPIYGAAVREVQRLLPELPPWLGLAGNYLGRLGVSALLDVARDTADRLARTTRRERSIVLEHHVLGLP